MEGNFTNLYAVVLYNFNGDDQRDLLPTQIGDKMVILNLDFNRDLAYGYIQEDESKKGYVPKKYLNFIDSSEVNFINTTFLMLCKKTFNDSVDNILCELMKKGAQINFKGEFGITPLMMACYFNDKELLSFLLEQNAKIDIMNEDEDTPLNIATYFKNVEIINTLVNSGSKNVANKYNESALSIADEMDNEEIKKSLNNLYNVDGEETDSMDTSDSNDYYSSFSDDYYSSFGEDSDYGVIEENCRIIEYQSETDIKNKIYKSICSIKVTNNNNKEICGAGFLVKLPIPSKEKCLYGLMTNNYILPSEYLQLNSSFEITINNKTFKINLNNNNFVFTSELIDITFIELTDNQFFSDPDIDFLNPDIAKSELYSNKEIIILTENKTLTFGSIKSLSGFNYNIADEGLPGSPLLNYDFNSDNLKITGILKGKKLATDFNIIEDVIRMIYNKRYIYDINEARENPRELNNDEKEELKSHGLEKTKINNVFKCRYLKSSKFVLFYKSNHGWYCTVQTKIMDEKESLKSLKWTFINPYEPIEKIIKKIVKKKLEHRHEVIIMWLKLSEFKYII